MNRYYHSETIPVSADCTDHIEFHCPKCKQPMETNSVETRVDGDKCTHIYVSCYNCRISGTRKFYWRVDK